MDAHRFILEITETALITHLGVANEVLDQLRLMGFEVALDDFGSGYSSVRYLASMPVDVVKFDISLIRLLANDTQRNIVLHMARMILESGYKLVAEGIESEEQLAQVREAGFAFGQGFLFGRPQEMVKALPPDRLHNTRS
jgi:EAL domain-containing protein (putative c-di-GMP-specific phosphodiesterase class I)